MKILWFISLFCLTNLVIPVIAVLDCLIKYDWKNHRNDVLAKILAGNLKYNKTNDVMDLVSYDFIIIGAGSGGATLAANLLQKTNNTRILIIEAGTHADNESICDYTKANLFRSQSNFNWNYESTPQINCFNRTLKLAAGRGLGGSSLINGMFWVRGDHNDYNEWADTVDDQSWNFTNVLPLFKEIERYPNGSILRGTNGPVFNSQLFSINDKEKVFYDGLASRYKTNEDYNSFSMYGVSHVQLNAEPDSFENPTKGIRQDAFSTQLRDYVGTNRLDIMTGSRAVHVTLNEDKQVEYLVFEQNGKRYRVRATRETILSAGSLQSPLILMRSGIGNCDELKELGIDCKVNLKAVGKNLQDHQALYFALKLKPESKPKNNVLIHVFDGQIKPALQKYPKPKFQITVYNLSEILDLTPDFISYSVTFLHPNSRGSVKLPSLNVSDQPIIDFNFLSTEYDLEQLIEGYHKGSEYASTLIRTGLADYLLPTIDNLNNIELFAYIRENVISYYHPCGTCKMGKNGDENAVVDSKLKVFGVKGLRVADASIMPEITSGNTNNPSMMIGAQCAKFLIQEHFDLTNSRTV